MEWETRPKSRSAAHYERDSVKDETTGRVLKRSAEDTAHSPLDAHGRKRFMSTRTTSQRADSDERLSSSSRAHVPDYGSSRFARQGQYSGRQMSAPVTQQYSKGNPSDSPSYGSKINAYDDTQRTREPVSKRYDTGISGNECGFPTRQQQDAYHHSVLRGDPNLTTGCSKTRDLKRSEIARNSNSASTFQNSNTISTAAPLTFLILDRRPQGRKTSSGCVVNGYTPTINSIHLSMKREDLKLNNLLWAMNDKLNVPMSPLTRLSLEYNLGHGEIGKLPVMDDSDLKFAIELTFAKPRKHMGLSGIVSLLLEDH
ncbi:hypothetical protein DFH27DRAFT_641798 [Peziza echinospora]|nr:hypothetical protein DFH27DRAFT_641798 [Peziza echinospora]